MRKYSFILIGNNYIGHFSSDEYLPCGIVSSSHMRFEGENRDYFYLHKILPAGVLCTAAVAYGLTKGIRKMGTGTKYILFHVMKCT